jgi:MarR family transcriptional regulator, organic hydroperoxide resistance regulator
MVSAGDAARELMTLYPRIYFACHTRHVRDPQTQRTLSRHQASVLDHLDDVDPMTLNGLARHMGVTPGTMSLTIDRLERKGYVVRLRDVADRRRVQLRLTAAGVRVREASSVLDAPLVEALVARLSDDQREAAVRGLALLAEAAQQQMAGRSQAGRVTPAEDLPGRSEGTTDTRGEKQKGGASS